jgi:hypothetical protein
MIGKLSAGQRIHYKHDEEDTGEIVAVHGLHGVFLYTVRWDCDDSPSAGRYRRDELIAIEVTA